MSGKKDSSLDFTEDNWHPLTAQASTHKPGPWVRTMETKSTQFPTGDPIEFDNESDLVFLKARSPRTIARSAAYRKDYQVKHNFGERKPSSNKHTQTLKANRYGETYSEYLKRNQAILESIQNTSTNETTQTLTIDTPLSSPEKPTKYGETYSEYLKRNKDILEGNHKTSTIENTQTSTIETPLSSPGKPTKYGETYSEYLKRNKDLLEGNHKTSTKENTQTLTFDKPLSSPGKPTKNGESYSEYVKRNKDLLEGNHKTSTKENTQTLTIDKPLSSPGKPTKNGESYSEYVKRNKDLLEGNHKTSTKENTQTLTIDKPLSSPGKPTKNGESYSEYVKRNKDILEDDKTSTNKKFQTTIIATEISSRRKAHEENEVNSLNRTGGLLDGDHNASTTNKNETAPNGTPLTSTYDWMYDSQNATVNARSVDLKPLMHQLMSTIEELQKTINIDQENDFRLRIALQEQTENAKNLRMCLAKEKERNARLLKLIQNVETRSSSTEDEQEYLLKPMNGTSGGVCDTGGTGSRRGGSTASMHTSGGRGYGIGTTAWHARTTCDPIETVSPLLMQQRYDELKMSYNKVRHQLAGQERKLMQSRCDREHLQAQYDELHDEYLSIHKYLEQIISRYMTTKSMKDLEIDNLKSPLIYAWDCTLIATGFLYDAANPLDDEMMPAHERRVDNFRRRHRKFMKALKECEWITVGCHQADCCKPGDPKVRTVPPLDYRRTMELDRMLKEDNKRIARLELADKEEERRKKNLKKIEKVKALGAKTKTIKKSASLPDCL